MALPVRSPVVFEYSILDPDHPTAFRLLDLLPGKPSAPIECILYHSERNTSPIPRWLKGSRLRNATSKKTPYSALSYTWGDDPPTKSISINGQLFKITPNLDEALRSLRYDESRENKARTLWIDAICVNQVDVNERNHQVAQMQEIYANAEDVIVWLGPATSTSSIAICFIEELYEAFEDFEVNRGYDTDFERLEAGIFDELLPRSASSGEKFEQKLHAIVELYLRPWWDRVWVIQELVSARRANFYCGKTSLQWPALALAIWLFWFGPPEKVGAWEILYDNHQIPLKRVWALVLLRHAYRERNPKSLGYLAELAQLGMCRDPRDKVYAVLGLAEDKVRKNLQPDYSKPVSWAYGMVVKAHFLRYKDVSVLNLAELTQDPVCPSWAPDLTRKRRTESFDPNKNLYRVSGKLDVCSATFSKELGSLYIDGFSVDTVQETRVQETRDMFSDISEQEEWPLILNKMVRKLNVNSPLRKISEDEVSEATKSSRGSSRGIHGILCDIANLINGDPINSEAKTASRSLEDRPDPGPETPSPPKPLITKSLLSDAKFWTKNRTIVISNTRYLGLAPEATRPGDHMFLLLGLGLPAILRPRQDGTWSFVGTAFILGLMGGEAMVDFKRGVYKKQRLELR